MNTFPRPVLRSLFAAACVGCLALAPSLYGEQGPLLSPDHWLLNGAGQHLTMPGDDALAPHAAQGYLGVDIRDVDTDRATQLKLKEARGAEVITVDHDAPAAKAGLKVHDVILSMNNQTVEGEAQLRQMLREMPAGKTVTFLISRDGQQQTLSVQLADRSTIEADAWSQHIPVPEPDDASGEPAPSFGNGFLSALGLNPLYTGLTLDMLGPQLADYFGVHDGQGLLVKRVDDNSPGAAAGLRAGDVITKVNGHAVATTSQWFRTIHANKGKPVQLTVMRNRKEATVNMMAGHPKTKGALDGPGKGDVASVTPNLDAAGADTAGLDTVGADPLLFAVQPPLTAL